MKIRFTIVGVAISTLAACGGLGTDEAAVPPQDTAAVAMENIPAYPQLAPDPAPPPTPSPNATPGQVPDRVQNALSDDVLETVTGEATFYADRFEGRRTASGVPFRQNQMVAAHRAYPFGTVLRVTNMNNQRSVNVRVVDRGPFGPAKVAERKVIDLSRRAAQQIGMIGAGRAVVQVEVLEWGPGIG
jgi:rare lipoprotein A